MASRPDPDSFAVCVFTASSDDVPERYRVLAREVGAALAIAGWRLVYGGGQVGLMGEVARTALARGGRITGVIPHKLNARERAFDEIDDLVLVDTLAERKQVMDERSDAFVVLPGGIGTLDELVEVMTTLHLGLHRRPIVLVDPDNYWHHFHHLLAHMVAVGVLRQATVDAVSSVSDAEELLSTLTPTA